MKIISFCTAKLKEKVLFPTPRLLLQITIVFIFKSPMTYGIGVRTGPKNSCQNFSEVWVKMVKSADNVQDRG